MDRDSDRHGGVVDQSVWYGNDRDIAAPIVNVQNEKLLNFADRGRIGLRRFADPAIPRSCGPTTGNREVLAAHGGSYLGSYAARDDHAYFVSPQNCNPNITLKKKPSEYLNQLF